MREFLHQVFLLNKRSERSWQLLVSWRNGYWSIWGRLHYTLIWLAAVVFILFAGYWNLLGWRF